VGFLGLDLPIYCGTSLVNYRREERGKEMTHKSYKVTITFETDRELTAKEWEDMEAALYLQVYEPADRDGNTVKYQIWSQILTTIESEIK
jgi:hypothetical protein